MKKVYLILVLSFFAFSIKTKAQIVNAYAQVSGITGLVLSVTNVDEANDTFEVGESIILMQMQADVLGNTTNTASFGDISAIGSAGRYEICQIQSLTESAGLPTTITIAKATRHTYTINANSTVQIISFPTLGTGSYSTTGNIQAKNWNGTTGGVLAFEVQGTLRLGHNLTADGAGFRGGITPTNNYNTCDGTNFILTASPTLYGQKGEGIYKATNVNYQYAKGKLLNGGGGGNDHNGGGGGGGNFTAGGSGGRGWDGCNVESGGLGGLTLGIYTSGRRVFLGGGGGGGHQNNSVGSTGGNGGGIILLKAKEVLTTGTGSSFISANGNDSANGGNDGLGGAGAGGSIVLEVQTWNVVNTFPINVRANGGNGGNVNSSIHGGGGGGGQGLVIFSGAIPTNNITSTTNNGLGGCNDTSCSSRAQNGIGANNQGLFGNVGTALPMTLKSFTATLETEKVLIAWEVVAYQPILYFEVQSSTDALNWLPVARVEASAQNLAYQIWDKDDFVNVRYYRLKQVENTQETAYSNVVAVQKKIRAEDVLLYPNPATQNTYLEIANPKTYTITVKNVLGQEMRLAYQYRENGIAFDLQNVPKGMYFISLSNKIQSITKKLSVQ